MVYKKGTPEYDRWKRTPAYDLWRARNSAAKKGERNPNYGKHHSVETRAKMCSAWTPERRQTRSETQSGEQNSFYGKHHSTKTLAKMSAAKTGERHPMYGKHHSAEARAKIRVARIGKRRSVESRAKQSAAISGEQHHNYGKHLSAKTRAKISAANSGEQNYMYGKHHSAIAKQKISAANRGRLRPDMCGSNNPNWHGGVFSDPYPVDWNNHLRETIRKRDNYICVLCGKTQTTQRHPVHHINYDKKDLCPTNLVTLCTECHLKTNGDRKYWIALFEGVYIPDFLT